MTSKVLDLTTMGHALTELCTTFLGDCEWIGINEQQQEFLSWWMDHRDEIGKLDSLEALASTDFAELNKFLTTHGFDPMFQPFDGFGVASILVEWLTKGKPTTISRYERSASVGYVHMQTAVDYPAFKIGADGVDVYDVDDFQHPLVQLKTKTGHSVWLMKADEPTSGLELNRLAQHLLTGAARHSSLQWTVGVTVPMLEMDLEADLSWMLGTTALNSLKKKYELEQVFQKFKLRANDKGARVKVVTGMAFAASTSLGPRARPYELDDPFIGFFTQPGNDTLPLAAFWADTDVWQNPGGTIEEL